MYGIFSTLLMNSTCDYVVGQTRNRPRNRFSLAQRVERVAMEAVDSYVQRERLEASDATNADASRALGNESDLEYEDPASSKPKRKTDNPRKAVRFGDTAPAYIYIAKPRQEL